MRLTKVRLLGYLKEKYGEFHEFYVQSAREVVDALKANFPDFKKTVLDKSEEGVYYRLVTTRHPEGMSEEEYIEGASPAGEITIVPVIKGSGVIGRIVAGVVLVAASFVTGFAPLGLLGASLILSGISQALTPSTPGIDSPERQRKEVESSFFNEATGISSRDHPIPLLYGYYRVEKPPVMSSAITTEDIPIE